MATPSWRGTAAVVMLALTSYLLFAIPHTIYHAAHEAPGLSSAADVMSVLMLAGGVIVSYLAIDAGMNFYLAVALAALLTALRGQRLS